MSGKIFSILTALLLNYNIRGQDFQAHLKENAIRINVPDKLNGLVYEMISDFQIIMVGEMHGTNEPVNFVVGLAELLSEKGESVQVGFEIPSEQMIQFLKEPADSQIILSDFFSKSSNDGRASTGWVNAISRLSKTPRVTIFFFDANQGECKKIADRDSIMYTKIKSKIRSYPSSKVITLSGNIHNRLLPYKENKTMAFYLNNDRELNISKSICSLNHIYQSGNMYNNIGNGVQINEVGNIETIYSSTLDFENYLFLFPLNYKDNYSGIFFSRTVTASNPTNKK